MARLGILPRAIPLRAIDFLTTLVAGRGVGRPVEGLPNYHVWTHVDKKWAINDWHWSFMAQPEPFPETPMNAVRAIGIW